MNFLCTSPIARVQEFPQGGARNPPPTGPIERTASFCMACQLRMVFTSFLMIEGEKKKEEKYLKMCKSNIKFKSQVHN